MAQHIALLIKTDNAHQRISGPATKTILEREHQVFNKTAYSNIGQISVAHIYKQKPPFKGEQPIHCWRATQEFLALRRT